MLKERLERNNKAFYKAHMKPKSDSREDIILYLWDIGLVNNYIKKLEYADIDEETLQDMILDVWLLILEIPEDKIRNLYIQQGKTGLTAYISGVIYRQIHSSTSKIYSKYKSQYKKMIHLSDQSWRVFDETGVMMNVNENYSSTETELDILIKNLENNLL